MEVKKYRFTATANDIEREVFPKNGNTLVVSWEKEAERALFTRKLKGKMLFDGEDFHWFNDLEQSPVRCQAIKLLIEKKCEGVWIEFFPARIILNKGDFDLDQCALNIEVDNDDKYACYEDDKDEERNLLDYVTSTTTANMLQGEIEEYVCEGDQDDAATWDNYWCGSGTPGEVGYVLKSLEKYLFDSEGNYEFRAIFVREKKLGTDLPLPWVSIGGGYYAKPPVLYNYTRNNINATGDYNFNYDVGGTIDNGMLLKDVMEYLLGQVCEELTLKSDFFQWNPTIETDINYVTEEVSDVLKLVLFQKSDVKRPNSESNATQAVTDFEKMLKDICNIFNLRWDVTDGGLFIIEHVSFFAKSTGINLVDRYDKKLRIGTRRYTYDLDNIYKSEIFTMMDQENYRGNFRGVPIKYNNNCSGKEDRDIIVQDIMTNVDYALKNPESDSKFVSDEGFVLMALDDTNGIISKASIFDEEYLNNTLSWPQLQVAYWRHEKLFSTFLMNNVETNALSVLPIRKQIKINASLCCGEDFDPNKKITTTLGVGFVDNATYGMYSEMLSLVLKYNSDDGHPMPNAVNDAFTTPKNVMLNVGNVLTNDTGIDIEVQPETKATTHGNVQLFADGTFQYTPTTDYVGLDTFLYTIIDNLGFTDSGTVTITVTAVVMPNAVNDNYINLVNNTLDQDGLMDNDTGVAVLSCVPEEKYTDHGYVEIFEDGHFVYTPDEDYTGLDTFTYTLKDGNDNTDTATVTIETYIDEGDAVAVDDEFTSFKNAGKTGSLIANDSGSGILKCVMELKATSNGGLVQISTNGTFSFAPALNVLGDYVFDYTLRDVTGSEDTATCTIHVIEDEGDAIAVDDFFETPAGESLTANVLTNDSGTGTLTCTPETKATTEGGTVQIFENGDILYTPDGGFWGEDTFEYTMQDSAMQTDSATVTIDVQLPSIAAVDDYFATPKNTTFDAGNVLTNDLGLGKFVTAETKATTHGNVDIFADGTFQYIPDFDFVGEDTFEYTLRDAAFQSDNATVHMSVGEYLPVALAFAGSDEEEACDKTTEGFTIYTDNPTPVLEIGDTVFIYTGIAFEEYTIHSNHILSYFEDTTRYWLQIEAGSGLILDKEECELNYYLLTDEYAFDPSGYPSGGDVCEMAIVEDVALYTTYPFGYPPSGFVVYTFSGGIYTPHAQGAISYLQGIDRKVLILSISGEIYDNDNTCD